MEVIMGLVNLTIVLFVVGIILYNKYKPTKDDRPEAPPCNTVEDYIRLESTDHLKTIARKLFYIFPVDTEYYAVSFRSSSWNNWRLRFTYKVPSNLLEEDSPDATMLLKILEERGDDPNAGFFGYHLRVRINR